jgi:hypothetical protein
MSKHTAGPWSIRRVAGIPGSVYGGVTRRYTNGSAQDQLFMVCAVQEDNGGNEAMEANARLIAAAPDLLNALVTLVQVARDFEIPTDAAEAAILKATT